MSIRLPRLVIAGLSGDSGKTIVSLCVIAALRRRGLNISVYKKGPDYIDAAWLSVAADGVCRNLDTYMVDSEVVRHRFLESATGSDLAIIEGNRGLYDGFDPHGTHSTAELANLLKAPVVLVVDATKVTRTVAAMINGCLGFPSSPQIAGIILNRISGKRHRAVVSDSIKEYCGLPVLGAIPRLDFDRSMIPGRHLGLITPAEYAGGKEVSRRLAEIADEYLDIEGIRKVADGACGLDIGSRARGEVKSKRVRIGYFRDSVFTFYYPENLEALVENGAELVEVSATDDSGLPDIDALYIGGGFPETQAERLTKNKAMLSAVRDGAQAGMPIYAECGGLIYLSRSIKWDRKRHFMSGVFTLDLVMSKKPAGHGYISLEVDRPNPFFEEGELLQGHEFHYSRPEGEVDMTSSCFAVRRGAGIDRGRDGLVFENVLACYTHIHADGVKGWAPSLVKKAMAYRKRRSPENRADFGKAALRSNPALTA